MHDYILILFGILIFIFGFGFIVNDYNNKKMYSMGTGLFEGFDDMNNAGIVPRSSCPDLLIKKDGKIYLYNKKKAMVPGVNPIVFNNLEDYSEFSDWQHANNIHCPVLQLEQVYDPQGHESYKIQPNILEPQNGLPPMRMYGLEYPNPTLLTDAGHNDPSYNWNSYPGFDSKGMNIGATTPLDGMDYAVEQNPLYPSPNPMDPNWGGADFTQSLINKGYYAGNEVQIAIP